MKNNEPEVLSFDEWINDNGFNFRPEQYDLYKFLYEAGQQSKQDEIDELQERIDEAIYDLQHIESVMWEEQVEHVLMVLKGDSHES